jgi:hypothetical protein
VTAIVDTYSTDNATAVVKPTHRIVDRKSGKAYDLGPFEVPVAWPRWGPVGIEGVLEPGDEVAVHCPDHALRSWLAQGGIIDSPGPGRKLGDAYAVPAGFSNNNRPSGQSGDTRIGRRDGTATVIITVTGTGEVRIQAPSVVLGAELSPKLAVARDTDPVSQRAALTSWASQVAGFINGLAPGTVAPPAILDPIGTISATSTEVESS